MDIQNLIDRIEAYCRETGYSPVTICRKATGNPHLLARLERRKARTVEDVRRIEAYISDNPVSDLSSEASS